MRKKLYAYLWSTKIMMNLRISSLFRIKMSLLFQKIKLWILRVRIMKHMHLKIMKKECIKMINHWTNINWELRDSRHSKSISRRRTWLRIQVLTNLRIKWLQKKKSLWLGNNLPKFLLKTLKVKLRKSPHIKELILLN